MILLLDNYDSFTYNLRQYIEEISGREIAVFRNDEISMEEAGRYDKIVLSPGPGLPEDAGIMLELIRQYYTSIPMLGICLGHQAIALAFGGKLRQMEQVLHGVSRKVYLNGNGEGLFRHLPSAIDTGRYHSWVPERESFPDDLMILGEDDLREIMILKHKFYPVYGMQFHPESILTPYGKQLIANWLEPGV